MDIKKDPIKIKEVGPVKNITMEGASQKASADPQSWSLSEMNHDFCTIFAFQWFIFSFVINLYLS